MENEVKKSTQGNLSYMTFYRGFAIIMIVMVHCTTRYLDKENVLYPYILQFFVNSTNIFLFISGFLFEYLLYKKYPYSVFIGKKIRRLIIPYLFWSIPVIIALLLSLHRSDALRYLVWTLWTGLDHLNDAHWYIPFIFIVFLISPLFAFLQKKKLLYPVVMPIFMFILLTSARASIGWFYGPLNLFQLLGMFFLGMFVSHYRDFILKYYKFDYLFILIGLLICVAKGYYGFGKTLHIEEAVVALWHGEITLNWVALNKLFFALGFFLLFYRISLRYPTIPVLEKLAHYSFAIYFVHLYIANALACFLSMIGAKVGGLIWFLAMSAIVMGASCLVVYILRKCRFTTNIIGV